MLHIAEAASFPLLNILYCFFPLHGMHNKLVSSACFTASSELSPLAYEAVLVVKGIPVRM